MIMVKSTSIDWLVGVKLLPILLYPYTHTKVTNIGKTNYYEIIRHKWHNISSDRVYYEIIIYVPESHESPEIGIENFNHVRILNNKRQSNGIVSIRKISVLVHAG